MTSRRLRDCGALLALGVVALALRLAYRIDYDEDIDALRLALAVDDFDIAAARPHAPYYPVYVALAKALALVAPSGRAALALLSALSGAVTVVACALLAFELAGRRAAILAGVLALASPFLWLSSEKCSSDMTGTAFFACALVLAVRARRAPSKDRARTLCMMVLGVGLGVRLSYFPFAIGCLVAIARDEGGLRPFAARLRDLAAGVVLWLVPLVVVAGPRALVAQTWIQTVGHFTRWGGSVVTVPSPAARLGGLVWGVWANVLGGAWSDAPWPRWLGAPIVVVLLVAGARRSRALLRRNPEVALASLLYLAWAALGQNIAFKPRHVLPLCPLLVVALAIGADVLAARMRGARALVFALAVQWIVDGEALARAHRVPSPAASIVRFLDESRDDRVVLTHDLARMITTGAPARRVVDVRREPELATALEASGGVFVTSEALSLAVDETLRRRGEAAHVVFSRPRSRYVDSLWNELALYAIAPPP